MTETFFPQGLPTCRPGGNGLLAPQASDTNSAVLSLRPEVPASGIRRHKQTRREDSQRDLKHASKRSLDWLAWSDGLHDARNGESTAQEPPFAAG
ncbi:hypothetical protein Pla8534_70460 [Lignipirellula cremea]|uniref:Uncharacterized protein n=1 Tax=Lignipirellula cremea TaxID=2528010 RepID=A0A518E4W5_9BACT|nr:hypothetical protein Pla8534_70460 [Lignipirellula cremea]